MMTGRAVARPAPHAAPAPPGAAAPNSGRAPHPPREGPSQEYGQWGRNQRPHGNLYGGASTPSALEYEAPENTGSLTGHILAQGRPDTGGSGNTTRVVTIMLIMLAAVVVVTVIAIS
jgi:hypothetical protein